MESKAEPVEHIRGIRRQGSGHSTGSRTEL